MHYYRKPHKLSVYIYIYIYVYTYTYYPVRKVSDLFCKNQADFNKVRLHRTTLNFHTHAWIFYLLPIASVDGKQVMFSALVGFSSLEKFPLFGRWKKYRHTWSPGNLITLIVWFFVQRVWIKCEECAGALSWWRRQLPVDHNSGLLRRTVLFGDCLTLWCVLVVYNENPTRALNTN